MSSTGVEEKPPWRVVPREVREKVECTLHGRVAVGSRVWGGYGPSPTFRLRLDDGRRAFLKAVWPGSNEYQRGAHSRELQVYAELEPLISNWSPQMISEFDSGEWRVMLLEDLGPKSAPPWTTSSVKRISTQLAAFHESTLGIELPEWLPSTSDAVNPRLIQWTFDLEDPVHQKLAALARPTAKDAAQWLSTHLPVPEESTAEYYRHGDGTCLLHMDLRSDNLRIVVGRLKLFDWPHVALGGPELDCVLFAQSVEVEGGPAAEMVLNWYSARLPLDPVRTTGALAVISGYFALHAWQPAIPGLPRLRRFQAAQLRVTLKWVSTRLGLPTPNWVDHVLTQS